MRKASMLLGLVLTLLLLVPVSALGKANGTDRPGRTVGSGLTTIDLLAQTFSSDWTGQVAHLGHVTGHSEGTWAVVPGPAIAIQGHTVVVAANGDKLFGTVEGQHSIPTSGEFFGGYTTTFTGGTGRFEGASGFNVVTDHSVRIFESPTTFVYRVELSGQGLISY